MIALAAEPACRGGGIPGGRQDRGEEVMGSDLVARSGVRDFSRRGDWERGSRESASEAQRAGSTQNK